MTYASSQLLTFERFLERHGDEPRHELADGELINLNPIGPHESVAGKTASKISVVIEAENLSLVVPKSCLLRPVVDEATARRPDVVVLDERSLRQEPYWEQEPVIVYGSSVKLVVEVVSTNWENDYARKIDEYALMGIEEYWIVDFRGLGGMRYIGDPKQPTFVVNRLAGRLYEQKIYRLGELIESPLFPNLRFQLNDLMPRF